MAATAKLIVFHVPACTALHGGQGRLGHTSVGMKTAETFLDEIHTESLQNLLTSVAFETSPPGCTHITALDAHCFATIKHHPSSLSSLNRGDVIEVQGPASSGKTHLLYHLIITCITASSHLAIDIGGWDKAAIVFDTDGTFNVHRLQQLLKSRLSHLFSESHTPLEQLQIEEVARKSLEQLHIFRPTSSNQLAATLLHLPVYHASHLRDTDIGLLAIDSISSFYWPDRFTVEQMRASPHSTSNFASPLQHVLTALQKFRLSHGPVTVMTNWGLNPLPNSSLYKQHLHPFPNLLASSHNGETSASMHEATTNLHISANENTHAVPPLTHHITLPFIPFPQIRSDISPEEAKLQQENHKNEVMGKCEVVGIIRTTGSSRVGRFVFQIGETEVMIGEKP